ncbi:MAG: lysylphosphatidylglycerol synthase transmembrane domain-containing protein [Candidatus Omnitrophota bacterium]
MKQKLKDIFGLLVRVGLSAALLIYLFRKIDISATWEIFKTADLTYILCAGAVFAVINFVLLVRWMVLIRALDIKVSLTNIFRYFFIGLFGNLFLPSAIGGDVIKTIGLCVHCNEKAKVVASVLLDRLSGFAGMAVVAIVSFMIGQHLIDDRSLSLTIFAMAAVSVFVGTVLFNEKIYSFGCRIFSRLPKIQKNLMDLHYDIALLKDKRTALYKVVALSGFAQVLAAIVSFFLGKALHQDILLIYFIIFTPIICVITTLPSIGGLGVREAGAAYLLAKVGVSSGIAVSISLMTFLFMVIVGLFGGIVYAATKSPVKELIKKTAETASP